jgi:hypothetical protein
MCNLEIPKIINGKRAYLPSQMGCAMDIPAQPCPVLFAIGCRELLASGVEAWFIHKPNYFI